MCYRSCRGMSFRGNENDRHQSRARSGIIGSRVRSRRPPCSPQLLRGCSSRHHGARESGQGNGGAKKFFARAMQSGASAKQLKTQVIEADGVALFLSRWTLHVKGATERTFTATTVFRKQPDGGWKALIDNPFGPLILGPEWQSVVHSEIGSAAQGCHATPKECSVILSPSVMVTGSTARRKAYSMSLLTMTHHCSCCTTPLHIEQQAAALYLLETRQTSCNCFSDPFSSSAPGFISHHPLHGVHPPHGCGARLLPCRRAAK